MQTTQTEERIAQGANAIGLAVAYALSPLAAPFLALPIRLVDKTVGIPTEQELHGPGLKAVTDTTQAIASLDQEVDQQLLAPHVRELLEAHDIRRVSVQAETGPIAPTDLERQLQQHFALEVRAMRTSGITEAQIREHIEQLSRKQNVALGAQAFTGTLVEYKTRNLANELRTALGQEFSLRTRGGKKTTGEGQIIFHAPTRALLVAGILGNPKAIPQALASFFIKNEARQSGVTVALYREEFDTQPSYVVLEGGFNSNTNILPGNAQLQWRESRYWAFISNTRVGRWIQRMGGLDPEKEHLEVGTLMLSNPQRAGDEAEILLAVKLDKPSLRGGARALISALTASQQVGEILKFANGIVSDEAAQNKAVDAARTTILAQGIRPDVVVDGAFRMGGRLLQEDIEQEAREATFRTAQEAIRQQRQAEARVARLQEQRERLGGLIQDVTSQLKREVDPERSAQLEQRKADYKQQLMQLDYYFARGGNPADANGQ
jgi:hypothetical protein